MFRHPECLSSAVSHSAQPVIYFPMGGPGGASPRELLGTVLCRARNGEPVLERGRPPPAPTRSEAGEQGLQTPLPWGRPLTLAIHSSAPRLPAGLLPFPDSERPVAI